MDRLSIAVALGSILPLLGGCGSSPDPSLVPPAGRTIVEVRKRLGATLSPADLTALGEDESKLLRALTASERLSLGQAYLRFRVDRTAIVSIAAPGGSVPFWLSEAGFRPLGKSAIHSDGPFKLWSRRFDAGPVGLGVNALDRRSPGHYLVFIQGTDGAPPNVHLETEGWHAAWSGADITPYADDARPFTDLPPELNHALILQPKRDWRDSTALVRERVWKTRLPSGPKPDQVVVSPGDDPARSLAWTWRTDPTAGASVVKLERRDGTATRRLAGTAREIASDGLLNDPLILRHVVEAQGLDPDTAYRYAVGDGSEAGWSAWWMVRTAPVGGRDYAFLEMGDPQCGLEEWGKLLHSAHARRPDAGFLLIAGDLVDRGNERGNWDHFFLRGAGVFEGLPLMPCVGNHEYLDKGPEIFSKSFRLPRNGPGGIPHDLTYAFEYSDSFVAVLDSNPAVYSGAMARRQAEWLDDRLSRTKARWKFVVFHHPIYPSHPSRSQPQLAAAWVPIFDRHEVDLVFQGHDHAYLRTYPMRSDRPVKAGERGTVYVVSVSGQKFVPLADRDYTSRGFADVATYQTVDISPRRRMLLYRALDVEGRELDRFEIHKPERGPLAGRPPGDPRIHRSSF